LIAAGAVALGVGIALEELRLAESLGTGVHMAILLTAGALIYWLGAQAPNEDGEPPAYQSVLLVIGLLLLFPGLLTVADVLGADFGPFPAGAVVWTSLIAVGLALWPALERNSAICLLLAAFFGAFALLSGWRFLFHASSQTPYRWLLLVLALACVLASLSLREPAPRHSQQLVNAAGLATAAIGILGLLSGFVTFVSFGSEPPDQLPGFWEVVLLTAGFGLIAFGALDRAPGPAYVGVLNTGLFVAAVATSPQATLYWWPLTLLVIGVIALAAGLRPRRPLPPEPRAYRAGEAPLAARADGEEIVVRVRED
jgi:MFS family permease